MLKGFKDFISRGNAMEMAVGIIIGAAFSSIVTALVEKFINPLIAGLVGKPNFDNVLAFQLGDATVMPGAIITALVNFLLVAIAVYFFIVVPMNKLAEVKKSGETEEVAVEPEIELLTEIRDILQKNPTA